MAFKKALTWQFGVLLAGSSLLLCPYYVFADDGFTVGASARPAPLVVQSTRALPALTNKFRKADGWTGADAAWTIPVSDKRTIWFFGDTWIGKIRKGKHLDATMINNTVGVQSLSFDEAEQLPSIDFFWRTEAGKQEKPLSFFPSDQPEKWLWPGAGAFADKRLFLVLHRIKKVAAKEPDFGFAEDGDLLASISNPHDAAISWRVQQVELPSFSGKVQFGNACFADSEYLFCYCTYRPASSGANQHPIILARLPIADLLKSNMGGWQFWCSSQGSESWQPFPDLAAKVDDTKPVLMFSDAAPEMSVSQVAGVPGYVAIYIAAFSPNILLRHSLKPEGPWSAPLSVYKCPEDRKKLFVYAAKAHPELAKKPGELILTYCRNTKFFADQVEHSDWYAPQAVQVFLRNK